MLLVEKTKREPNFKESYQDVIYAKLYPLYEDLLKVIGKSEIVNGYEILSKRDIPFYGDTKQITSDTWDIIELRIKINFNNNCKNKNICNI